MFSATVANSAARGLSILAQMPGKVIVLLALALAATPCMADTPAYSVVIDAPPALTTLLEKNLDLLRWRGNAQLDAAQLERLITLARAQAQALVATEGYYSAQADVTRESGTDGIVVRIKLEPGAAARVDGLDLTLEGFDGQHGVGGDPVEVFKREWALPVGSTFRQADWELAKRRLLRQALQTRYPRAQLADSSATVDPATGLVRLRVKLCSGPAVLLGAPRIEGLRRYPKQIVTNLNPLTPGAEYSETLLQAFQSRLQESAYFANVEVGADLAQGDDVADACAPTATPLTLPVLVRVTENKFKNTSVGLGYSTNTGNRAQVSYDDLSLFGLRLKSGIIVETRKQAARGDLYFPTTAEGYNDSTGATFERTDITGEVTSVATLAARRAWGTPLQERSFTLEYVNEHRSVDGQLASSNQSLPVTYGLTRRVLDNLLFPSVGYAMNAQLGGTPLPILTEQAFARASARLVVYRPIGVHNTLLLRLEAGAVVSKQKAGIPANYLFRAGGDQSVRGYGFHQLGVQEGSAIVGGRYLLAGSVEYQFWPQRTWGGAVFYDAGNAGDIVKDLKPKSGYGVGVRWRSPVGPINFDAAYGHAVHKYRLHFSLGFTF